MCIRDRQKEFKKFGYLPGGNSSAVLIKKEQEIRDNPTDAEVLLWEQLK